MSCENVRYKQFIVFLFARKILITQYLYI